AGPGDEGLLTVRAAELLGQASLVVAAADLAPLAQRHMSPDAQLADPADGAATTRTLVQAARGGQLVVRLYRGDPLLNGAVADAAACAKAGVRFEIVPGVPAATAVPAYAGIPLATEPTGEVRIIHAAEATQLAYSPATLVVLGAEAGPAELGKMLIAAGWPDGTRLAITWDGTTSAQQTVVSSLGRIGPDLKAAGVSLANTLGSAIAVVGDAVGAREQLSWFETKPLFGWRVLVPRTKEQAAMVSQRLREYGAVPEEVPTIAVEPPRTPQQMERAVKGLVTGRYQWVAFTSTNAVRAVRERFEEYGLDARAFAGVKVAAVGEQTSAALLDFGIRPDLVPEGEQSAEGLAEAWPPYDDLLDPINRVLLPRADIATETLLARLIDLGWEAEDVTAYRTVRAAPPPAPIREAIKGGGFDAVLFTSSSTVRNLVGIAGKPHAVTAIGVIGPQTAKTAAEFGLRVDVTAPKPSMDALVDAMAEYGASLRDAARQAGEPVRRPSERRRGARRRLR
ncbi:MAG: uroporphyrinogen-III synthase, partial [Streptosporangiaceae bacterium]